METEEMTIQEAEAHRQWLIADRGIAAKAQEWEAARQDLERQRRKRRQLQGGNREHE